MAIQEKLAQEELAHVKLLHYINREKELHAMAKQLATFVTSKSVRKQQSIEEIPPGHPIKRTTLIFMSDAHIGANSPIKGYVRTPIRRFIKVLSIYADLVKV